MPSELVTLASSMTYGTAVIEWLLERKEELPGYMVVVPTAQSSRRLRQGLAERGGLLAPKVVTTGILMSVENFAPDAVEILAWTEALEAVKDWEDYGAIFPASPASDGPGWALGLAKAFVDLRKGLQENGLLLASAARLIASLEQERWEQLARLETVVEGALKRWGYESKSSQLASEAMELPGGVTRVVIAGVLDLPPVVTRFLEKVGVPVSVLVPDARVDEWGRPGLEWNEAEIGWPENGSVTLTGDPRQQADLAMAHVAASGSGSESVGLGTGDEEVATELVRSFGRAGWGIHDPGASLPSSVAGWLSCWRRYLQTPGVKEVIDLLAFDQGRFLVAGIRAQQVEALSALLDSHLVRSLEDVTRARILIEEGLERTTSESKKNRLGYQRDAALVAEKVMEDFAVLRKRFLGQGFHAGMRTLLNKVDRDDEAELEGWLESTAEAAKAVKRSPGFWIDLLLRDLGPVPEEAPEGRVLDVQGWLELLHEPAPHLIVCGMNEGRVPSRSSSDSWLPESARQALGLPCEESRAARDAYLLNALLEMRRENGRVDLIVGKSSLGGDVLMPSRLLLTAKGKDLAEQVKELFANVEPADSGVAWTLEDHWRWKPRVAEPRLRMSVTAFSKYLACPFRYYLQRVVGMNEPEPERVEWNHRDFGNVLHEVLEQWGRNEVARDSADAKGIEGWLLKALDKLVARHFGEELPLAVSLQVESMRLRLGWFAEEQAETRANGWQIFEVEKYFELEIAGATVTGQIDRIERHEDGRIRVLDYKSSKEAKDVVKEHQKLYRDDPPEHLRGEEVVAPGGKVWTDLQVPFYADALGEMEGEVDEVGYFALGQDRGNVKITRWVGFGEEEKISARKCAEWIVGQVQAKVFWPPAEKVRYDDFEDLAYGRDLKGAFDWKGGTV
ncbi:MAG: PD-(D/E)XK nuclease family protein [Akkermansiaceae bacterium]|nr:PD-(D/E)XK nuclease family protein [Akkermansiaceae bacterium]